MRVVIDKSGCDRASCRIDHALGGSAVCFADADDLSVLHGHIGLKRRLAGAVNHTPVPDYQIVRHPASSPESDLC
jgi:hypothetical protein